MPRIARRISKTKIYHVIIREINQQNNFAFDEDHEKIISIFDNYHYKIGYEIYVYCLMGNHVQLFKGM